jgi:PAS domain S-box-containing protein/diguanylate cyclase (GGDEF)-like protein
LKVPFDPEVYRTLLESMPNGVYLVDRERRILLWNEGAERISGYLRQEVMGCRCQDDLLVHCDENNAILCGAACPLMETMNDGRPRVADVFLRHKCGQRVPVRVRAVPIREPGGTVIGAAEVFDERVLLPETEEHPNSRAVHDSADPLTGIPDQESARRHLDGWLLDFADSHIPFALLMIAIDGLDGLRHSRGAGAAEAILRVAARTVSGNLRPSDVAGCWRKDRFAVILADCPAHALPRVAGMLQRILSAAAVSWWGDRISIAASMGSTAVIEGDTAETILARAEAALAASIAAGGNRVTTL